MSLAYHNLQIDEKLLEKKKDLLLKKVQFLWKILVCLIKIKSLVRYQLLLQKSLRAFEVKKKFEKMLILLSVRGNFLIALNSFHF